MLTTTHLITGAVIGKVTGNVYLTIPAAFLSHYLLDVIPHYCPPPVRGYLQNGLRRCDKIDLLLKGFEPVVGLAVVCVVAFYWRPELLATIAIGSLFSWLPDSFVFLDWKYGIGRNFWLHWLETRLHRHTTLIKGIIPQLILISSGLVFLFW